METTSGSGATPETSVVAPPPPSPLSGAYLLIVVGEPHTDAHKQDILRKIANGFLSWDVDSCHVDLDKELQAIISAAPDGEEARNGERLIQFASENLVTEVLIQPQLNTLIQCIRNLLSSFTKHRHIIHAGYTFAGNGSWIVQDGTFSLADLIDALQEPDVQRVLRAYEHSVTVDIHCAPEGDWSTARLRREACTRLCRVRVNPDDGPTPAANIQQFVDYLAPFVRPQSIDQLLHPSDVVGNIRFSHPTLYVFPGGQGDAALFGINGFNMLVDGGFARKACFWDFVRHLDRLDAVLMTRINNSNCHGLSSILRRKRLSHVYPQIGHFFCNLQERKQPSTPDEEKVRDPLLVNLLDEGQEIVHNLKHLQLKPHNCVRDSVLEPINLYHKVGHGKLDMYVISPARDSKELKEFLSKWHSNDVSLFNSVSRKPGDKDISFPFHNLVSICALLVWQPANPEDTITRILFPGSTPQHKIFEGLEKLRSLDFMKQPVCTAKTLSPSSSTTGINIKVNKTKSTPAVIDKLLPGEGLSKPVTKGVTQSEPVGKQPVAKTSTIPVSGSGETKVKPIQPTPPKPAKQKQEKQKVEKDNKTEVDKNIEVDAIDNVKPDKPVLITDQLKEKESIKIKNEKTKAENKTKKTETKITSRITEKKPTKVPSVEKKDSVKSSPTTPKKSVESKINGVASKAEIIKSAPKPKLKTSPSSTPAKSTKEENNRKVVESKAKAAIASKTSAPRQPKRDDSVVKQKPDKKLIKKPLSSSPVKLPSKTISPVKSTAKTLSKSKKDSKKLKGEIEKGIVTDSSTVSTPSTVDAETAIAKEGRVEIKGNVDSALEKDVGSGKYEEKAKLEDENSKDNDESVLVKDKAEEASVSEDVLGVDKPQDRHIETSEKEYSEKEEEDEILIIEKVEIDQYGDDSVQDQESLESHVPDDVEDEIQKHLRDEAESEKRKDDQPKSEEVQDKESDKSTYHEGEMVKKATLDQRDTSETTKPSDLPLSLVKEISTEKVLTPENLDQIEEEVQEIITSATDFVAKTKLEQSKESSELSADGIGSDEQKTSGETKDLLSSPEKFQGLSDKNLTDDDNKHDDIKDRSKEMGDVRYAAEESQPDEKMSTTVESGATTAPTLPEDERITLDEIKEGIEEKYDKEDTKEKEIGALPGRIEQPTTLPQVSIVPGGPYEVQATQMLRDIVKTPDEVADLPVHEEVDGLYEEDDFNRDPSKSKEDLLSINGMKDGEIKEGEKEDLAETNDKLELDEPITKKGPVLSTDKICEGDASTKLNIKTDDEELHELKVIREKLEAEDYQQEQKEADQKLLPKGLDIDSKHEMVLETKPVHSTLKAPEVAELVMVTPDSAPESPLHLSTEKKYKPDEKPPIDNTKVEKNHDIITTPKVNESQHIIKCEEIEESLDMVMDLKKSISSPKTPPASPVLGDLAKEKGEIDIIPGMSEIAGISKDMIGDNLAQQNLEESKINTNLDAIPESGCPAHEDDVNSSVALTTKEQVELEKKQTNEEVKAELDDATKSSDIVLHEMELSLLPEKEMLCPEKSIKEGGVKLEQSVSEISESPKEVPLSSNIRKDSLKAQDEESIVEKHTSLVSRNPLVADDFGESLKLEQEQTVNEKLEYVKSISPALSDKRDENLSVKPIEQENKLQPSNTVSLLTSTEEIPTGLDVTDHINRKQEVSKSMASSKNEEDDLKKEITLFEKSDLPDSTSPLTVNEENLKEKLLQRSVKDDTEPMQDAKSVHDAKSLSPPCSPIPSEQADLKGGKREISITDLKDSTTGIGSLPTNADISKENEPAPSSKHESPLSTSPLPGDSMDHKLAAHEKGKIIVDKPDSPETASPVPSEKRDSIDHEEEQSLLEKQISPTNEPVASEKRDSIVEDKEQTLPKNATTPKSSSPVPLEKEDNIFDEKEHTSLDKHITQKSDSPVPSEKKEGITQHTEQVSLEKPLSPQSISPVPSEKVDTILDQMEQTKSEEQNILEVQVSLKSTSNIDSEKMDSNVKDKEQTLPVMPITSTSISPVPSEKQDTHFDKTEHTTLEKQIAPTSYIPAHSEKSKTIAQDKEHTALEKPISSHSISPVPSEIGESMPDQIEQTKMEKQLSPKSISPVPSEKRDCEVLDAEQTILDKMASPTNISPVPSEREERIFNGKEHASLETQIKRDSIAYDKEQIALGKPISPKSMSPVPSEKETISDGKVETNLEKGVSPKSVSPVPSDMSIAPDKEQATLEKSISPVPSEKGETIADGKEQTHLEKQVSPKSVSPVPTEKRDSIVHDKEQTTSEKSISTPKSISPVPSEKGETIADGKEQTHLEKQVTPKSISPVPSEKRDSIGHDKEQNTPEKSISPKSISPIPADKGETVTDGYQQTHLEKQVSPKSVSPIPSEKVDSIVHDKEQTTSEKSISTPKSISPTPSDKGETISDGKEQTHLDTQVTPKSVSPVPSEKRDSIVHDKEQTTSEKSISTPKSISPIPAEKGETISNGKEQTHLEKQVSPKSTSPVPSEKRDSVGHDKEQTTPEKSISPKSISPIPADKGEAVTDGNQQIHSEKQVSPKSVGPIPSEKVDSIVHDKEQTTSEKSISTPKSISPTPSDKGETISDGKEQTHLDTQVTPKSVSPVPSEKRDSIVHDKEQTTSEKSISTPKSISPIPAEKGETISNGKEQTHLEKQVTPKSTSPVPSEKRDSVGHDKEQTTPEKSISPKSISPIPADKGEAVTDGNQKLHLEKQVSPKSVSPIPSEKVDSIVHDKEQTTSEKSISSSKSISPIPSDKGETISDGKEQTHLETQVTPKSISPVPSEKETIYDRKVETNLEKGVSPKSISPVPSDMSIAPDKEQATLEKSSSPVPSEKGETIADGKDQTHLEKQVSPKSISPVPSEKRDSIGDKEQATPEKSISPKSISPIPADKGETITDEKTQTHLVKQVSPKSVSPVPSEKRDSIVHDKEKTTSEKSISTPKSISPIPADRGETTSDGKEQTHLEKQVTPKSISPVPSEKRDSIGHCEELTTLEKSFTSKSISPILSEKGEPISEEKEQFNLEMHVSPKSISPVHSEKMGSLAHDKEQKPLEKSIPPTSISPLPSENAVTLSDGKEQTILEKSGTQESISPIPSEKGDTIPEKNMQSSSEKQDTPKSISPVHSEKGSVDSKIEQTTLEKGATPKSISPLPSEKVDTIGSSKSVSPEPPPIVSVKENELQQQHDTPKYASPVISDEGARKPGKEETSLDNQNTPKCISPMLTDMVDKEFDKHETVLGEYSSPICVSPVSQIVLEKTDTPKSISPVSSDKGETKLGWKGQVPIEKVDTPKSISPVPSDKGECQFDNKAQEIYSEKQDTPKSISPVFCDKEQAKVDDKAQTDSEKHVTPKSVSPVPSDKEEPTTCVKEQTISEKHESPKSISPLPSDKENGKGLEKETEGSEKQDTPKCLSPLLSDKVSSELPENELPLKEKHDSPHSTSHVPNDAPDTKQPEKDKDTIEKHDTSQSVSPIHSDKVEPKTSKVSITETEKADTELSEKEKDKIQLASQLKDCSFSMESRDYKFTNESHSDKQEVSKIPTKVIELDEKICKTDLESVLEIGGSANVTSLDHSSSDSRILKSEADTAMANKQLGHSDISCIPMSALSEKTPSPVNGNDDSGKSNDLTTEEDNMIEKLLASKSIKTERDIKSNSESIVPSNVISHGLDSILNESSADLGIKDSLTYSSVDHGSTAITEHSSETKSGLHSVDISSVSSCKTDESESLNFEKDEISSSVHRMLVTGSSEDGGTETELCSSSVIKFSSGSCDKNLGNVAHVPQEEPSMLDQVATFSEEEKGTSQSVCTSKEADLPHEKTITTTTVSSADIKEKTQQINESTKSSDVVKTMTTTVTKTFGDHPSTEVKTTQDIVPSSAETSSHADIESTVKKSEVVSSGILSQSLKREVSDAGRSGTPASDLASERELETGGISTPHSDISSGQVSRAATHVWGESSEGRPDSRHCDSDDDVPCSPMSATSHMAQSPPQFDFDIHQHAKGGLYDETSKPKDSSLPTAMTSSLYGSLPDDPLEEYMKSKQLSGESQMYSSMYVSKYGDDDDNEDEHKTITGTKVQSGVQHLKTEDIDFETAIKEHKSVRGEDLTVKYTNGKPEASVNGKSSHSDTNGLSNGKSSQPDSLEYQVNQSSTAVSSSTLPKSVPSQPPVPGISSSSSSKPSVEENKDPIEGWGKPLGLPPPPKNLIDSPLSRSTLTLVWNPADEWGIPLGLPSPAPPPVKKDSMNGEIDTEITSTSNKTTPKKVARRNAENNKSASNTLIGKEASNKSKHPESPVKRASNKDAKSKSISPVYMDLTYVPHHGNSNYTNVEFFKRIRARYYVFSGTEPSREVFNALLEAKQTWEDQDLEVTIIPTYDTDTLGYWVAENEDLLAKYKIDLSPSASRCTINLQDHETSCSAYRLEF